MIDSSSEDSDRGRLTLSVIKAAVLACLLATPLSVVITSVRAQGLPPPKPLLFTSPEAVAGQPNLGGGEERAQTIAKCLADLATDDVGARLRAVMILGKYPTDPQARAALLAAIRDDEVRVRRAAVVSLGEGDLFVSQVSAAVLRTLSDPDVEVRRLSSSMLPRIVMSLPMQPPRPNMPPGSSFSRMFPPGTEEIILKAFSDDDGVVRRNMLGNEALLREILSVEILEPLLRDENAESRALALAAIARKAPPTVFLRLANPLRTDGDPHVRQALARAVGQTRDQRALPILQFLLDDDDITVAATAARELFISRKPIAGDRLLELIESREIEVALAEQLITYYPVVDTDSRNAMIGLTEHPKANFRAAAVSSLSRVRGELALDSGRAVVFLQDPSEDVRRAAQRILFINHDLTAEHLNELISSPHEDVRQFVLSASRTIDRAGAKEILYELLLDESSAVRRQVITEFARQRFPESMDILSASLEDDDAEIQRAAVSGLFQMPHQQSTPVLQQFARETKDAELRAMVVSVLASRARSHPSRPVTPARPTP
jgi:HEAT repeat protein